MKIPKVYVGQTYKEKSGLCRTVIAAENMDVAAYALKTVPFQMRHYWRETKDRTDYKAAMTHPGKPMSRPWDRPFAVFRLDEDGVY